jgi:oligopeptide/dipeptide ABC transporter ATP-binding protein
MSPVAGHRGRAAAADPRRADLGARRFGAGRDPALLQDLKWQFDLSYLFVSHDLNVVRLLCDRILVMYLGHIVESGPADWVFAAPAHPYTQALLSAVPKPGAGGGRSTRIGLPGEPRSPIDPDPNICPLYGRCGRAAEECVTAMPALRDIASGRFAACHYPIAEPAAETQKLAAIA